MFVKVLAHAYLCTEKFTHRLEHTTARSGTLHERRYPSVLPSSASPFLSASEILSRSLDSTHTVNRTRPTTSPRRKKMKPRYQPSPKEPPPSAYMCCRHLERTTIRSKKRGKSPTREPPPAPRATELSEPPPFLSEYADEGRGVVAELEGFQPVRKNLSFTRNTLN